MLDPVFAEEEMCPIGVASRLLADRWVTLIIRDIALFDRRTFNDLLRNNREGISSASLASRLQYMVQIDLLHVVKSQEHAQKKLYYLSEPAIALVPIIFQLAGWSAAFRRPSADVVALLSPYLSNDERRMEYILKKLRRINIDKDIDPEPLWWTSEWRQI
ncbi:MAG: winged helix-turn-helix transcriptional regulator [Hyphomonas sp.]